MERGGKKPTKSVLKRQQESTAESAVRWLVLNFKTDFGRLNMQAGWYFRESRIENVTSCFFIKVTLEEWFP